MTEQEDFLPCPRCGGDVDWTNTRNLNVLTSSVHCESCGLDCFSVETVTCVLPTLPNLDYKTTLMKWNAWVKTSPKRYCEEVWE